MADPAPATEVPLARRLGRYELIAQIASGGMGSVLLARLGGVAGFQRLFAIKLLHPVYANDEEFIQMLLDEARIAARIHHPNVVSIQEVCKSVEHGYFVVMDYVEGFSLADVAPALGASTLQRWRIAVRVMLDTLAGLEAAHALTDDSGVELNVVHRDLSPQNILVGMDGVARVTDFGIAKANTRISSTSVGKVKGKLTYMAPEQVRGYQVDARTDLFAAGIVFWELLTATRLFRRASDADTIAAVRSGVTPSARSIVPGIPAALDRFCTQALAVGVTDRYVSAREMSRALESIARAHDLAATSHEVAVCVRTAFALQLSDRRDAIRDTGGGALSHRPVARLIGALEVPLLTATVVAGKPARKATAPGLAPPPVSQVTAIEGDNEAPTAPNTKQNQLRVAEAIAAVVMDMSPPPRSGPKGVDESTGVIDPEQDEDPTQLTTPEAKAAILAALAAENVKAPPRPRTASKAADAAKAPPSQTHGSSPVAPTSPIGAIAPRMPAPAVTKAGPKKHPHQGDSLDEDMPTDQSGAGVLQSIAASVAITPEHIVERRGVAADTQAASDTDDRTLMDADDDPTSVRRDYPIGTARPAASVAPSVSAFAPAMDANVWVSGPHQTLARDPAGSVLATSHPTTKPRGISRVALFNSITVITLALIGAVLIARRIPAVSAMWQGSRADGVAPTGSTAHGQHALTAFIEPPRTSSLNLVDAGVPPSIVRGRDPQGLITEPPTSLPSQPTRVSPHGDSSPHRRLPARHRRSSRSR